MKIKVHEIKANHLQRSLPNEGIREHAIFHADSHELCRVTVNRRKIDAVLPHPRFELGMGGNLWPMTFCNQSFAQCDIRLYISTRSNRQTSNA